MQRQKEEHHIFVIDDNEDVLEIINDVFEENDFNVTSFSSAGQALAALKINKPSLIVSDLNMPRMNGIEFLNAIRDICSEIPFIFLTANVSDDLKEKSKSLGVSGFVAKPFREEELIQETVKALKK